MSDEVGYDNRLVTQAEATAMVGPILAGDVVALILYGILLSNLTRFIRTSSWAQSGRMLRSVVLVVVLLTTGVTALYAVDIWQYGTYSPATDTAYLEQGSINSALQPAFLVIIAVLVQSTLVLRAGRIIEKLRWRNMYYAVTGTLIAVEIFAGVCAAFYEIRFALLPDEDYSIGNFSWTTSIVVWLWLAAGVDVLISAVYVSNLSRRLGGVANTVGAESIIKLIVSLVIRSAAYTAILAVVSASVMSAYPGWDLMKEDIYYAFWIPLPALYALSLFTTLSIRERVTAELEHQRSLGRSLSGSAAHATSSSKRKRYQKASGKPKSRSKSKHSSGVGLGWHLSLCAAGHSSSTLATPPVGVRVQREVVVSKSEVIEDMPDSSSFHQAGPLRSIALQDHGGHLDEEKAVGLNDSGGLMGPGGALHGASWCRSWAEPDENAAGNEDAECELNFMHRKRARRKEP